MSQRTKIAKEINTLEKEILSLEAKRSRPMAVLWEALISKTTPNDEDVQFFRTFSATIEIKREQLQMLTRQLEGML